MFSRIVLNSPNDGRGLSDGTLDGDSTDNEVEEGGGEGNLENIDYFVFFTSTVNCGRCLRQLAWMAWPGWPEGCPGICS